MNKYGYLDNLIKKEEHKQKTTLSLIASENLASKRVQKILGTCLTNKYAEGYPNNRYYAGCAVVDEIEEHAISLAKQLFNAKYANVQPHSGSQSNQAVFLALLNFGDCILSLSLESGGHLTHGAKVSSIGSMYKIVHYNLNEDGLLNYEEIEQLAKIHKPKLIIAGGSAYSRHWNWERFRQIANLNNSFLMADIAHTAGLIAGKVHENPINFAHVLTSTTHKTLRGARGGVILSNCEEIFHKLNKAVFPGVQGGPLMNAIAAKAAGFEENLAPEFGLYAQSILFNAKVFEKKLKENSVKIVSNGTDNHLMILDCKSFGLTALEAQILLETANVFISKSALIGDSWQKATGIRIGVPYITTLKIEIEEFAELFVQTLLSKNNVNLKKYVTSVAPKLVKEFYKN